MVGDEGCSLIVVVLYCLMYLMWLIICVDCLRMLFV